MAYFSNGLPYDNFEDSRKYLMYSINKLGFVNVYFVNDIYGLKTEILDEILFKLIEKYKKVCCVISNEYSSIFFEFIKLIKPISLNIVFNSINNNYNFIGFLNCGLTYLNLEANDINVELYNLPLSLKKIRIYTFQNYNYRLDYLPYNLEELHILCKYSLPLDNLPPNLLILQIQSLASNNLIDNLPDSLEMLIINDFYPYCFNRLPSSLEFLSFHQFINTQSGRINYNPEYMEELKQKKPKMEITSGAYRFFSSDSNNPLN